MSNNGSYGNDKGVPATETDYAVDPASGSFFHSDYKKHDDLKEMLDSNKDNLKLEAMKRIIGMVAKGKDASELFPAVVKNVVSKNIEVKKLVYVYLVRYAEEQQDLALLSISTFQRALKEPNQLIRAGALRVLSSIRVSMIVPIVMLAIREAAADMSPYVRKTAAHAISKLYSLDKCQKPELVSIIERLLADRATLVVGSAVMAFTEVCPERSHLIHKVFRKLCTLLIDVDEWGQIVILNMLTRYARTQFIDPNIQNIDEESKSACDSSSDISDKISSPALDPDHRLLLRSARPLLQSQNAAVVMAVAQLYHHTAPRTEILIAARALVRLLRSHTEVQGVVLDGIASISLQRKGMFEPYLKSFFVRTSDPTRIKLLKLDILTNLATENNVSVILRELRTYISSNDKTFVAATIQAIGRVACAISEITDFCLSGLVSLLSNRDEAVVAESVVVIKRLLQTRASEPRDIVSHMAKLLDSITVPQARAAILWLLGEHCNSVTQIAPDVLRKMAKSFCQEHDIVKLQILNLAIKLIIVNPKQLTLLCQYVFNLARYDLNYDIRDRARLLKYFMESSDSFLVANVEKIFLVSKPAPLLQSRVKDRTELQLGSLSHYINVRANGYQPLPNFPEVAPPGNMRDVDGAVLTSENVSSKENNKKEFFFWSSSSSSPEASSDEEDSSASLSDDERSNKHNSETEEPKEGKKAPSKKSLSESEDEESDSSSSEETSSNSEDDSKETENNYKELEKPQLPPPAPAKSNLDLLLDLDDVLTITPVMTPSLGGFLSPGANYELLAKQTSAIQMTSPGYIPTKNYELLDKINGRGLNVQYRYSRSPHLFSSKMLNISLTFSNTSSDIITDIKMEKRKKASHIEVHDFASITSLAPSSILHGTLGINFNDSTEPFMFDIISSAGIASVSIKPSMGELFHPVTMSEETFQSKQSKLRGLYEHSITIKLKDSHISDKVLEYINVGIIISNDQNLLRFAGQSLSTQYLVLLSIIKKDDEISIVVNCENVVHGEVILNGIKSVFVNS